MMRMEIAITQAAGLRRVAADLDRVWVGHLKGGDRTTPDEFLGSMLAAPVLRALAAELALKAVAIKTTGAHKRGHDLLKLFDALDQKTQTAIGAAAARAWSSGLCMGLCGPSSPSTKATSPLRRYVGEMPPGSKPTFAYGDDLDVALQDLIAVFEELPSGAR